MVVAVGGEIDVVNSQQFDDYLSQAGSPGDRVVLDLSAVDFMDTSALAVIVGHWRRHTDGACSCWPGRATATPRPCGSPAWPTGCRCSTTCPPPWLPHRPAPAPGLPAPGYQAATTRPLAHGRPVTSGTSGSAIALTHCEDEKAEQPDDQDDQGDPPQDVDREAEAAQDEREQEDEQDERHELVSFFLDGGPELPSATRRPALHTCLADRSTDMVEKKGGSIRQTGVERGSPGSRGQFWAAGGGGKPLMALILPRAPVRAHPGRARLRRPASCGGSP